MKRDTLEMAIAEAKRFIRKAELLIELEDEDNLAVQKCKDTGGKWCFHESFGKENAAVKRASLDLTRSLADLRQNR